MGFFDLAEKPENITITEKILLLSLIPILLILFIRLLYLIIKYYQSPKTKV